MGNFGSGSVRDLGWYGKCQGERVGDDAVVLRYLFYSQCLALISWLIFGAWFYIMLTVSSFVFSGLHLLQGGGRFISLRSPFVFTKHIRKGTKNKTYK